MMSRAPSSMIRHSRWLRYVRLAVARCAVLSTHPLTVRPSSPLVLLTSLCCAHAPSQPHRTYIFKALTTAARSWEDEIHKSVTRASAPLVAATNAIALLAWGLTLVSDVMGPASLSEWL